MIRIMIAYIKGKIFFKGNSFLVVETGGIGYKVFVSKETAQIRKEEDIIELFTYMAVRENALDLYGFSDKDGLEFFELLLSVPGIGPKSALSILNAAPIEVLRRGISLGDTAHLSKVSGIGKKSAEKIVVGLHDKFEKMHTESDIRNDIDALEALTALGYREREAREALRKVSSITNTGEKVKQALKILGRGLK